MKNCRILLLIILLSLTAFAQEYNKVVPDEETGEPMLIGYTTREAFNDTNFSSWFDIEYDDYVPDSAALAALKGVLDDVSITVVMGTWCDDSRRDIPRLFKILDLIRYPAENVKIISVNQDKFADLQKPDTGEIYEYRVELVPTIILSKDGKELGKIEELPQETLEKDILKIISQ